VINEAPAPSTDLLATVAAKASQVTPKSQKAHNSGTEGKAPTPYTTRNRKLAADLEAASTSTKPIASSPLKQTVKATTNAKGATAHRPNLVQRPKRQPVVIISDSDSESSEDEECTEEAGTEDIEEDDDEMDDDEMDDDAMDD
jgi:hypothetical protein